jgi:hypothetical protein
MSQPSTRGTESAKLEFDLDQRILTPARANDPVDHHQIGMIDS